jgi:hypothetical protein
MKRTFTEAFSSELDASTQPNCQENSTQTTSVCLDLKDAINLKLENHQLKRENEDLKKKITQIAKSKELSIDNLKHSDKDMRFYTGLSHSQFICLWNFLGPNTRNISRVSYPRKHEVTPSKARGAKRKLTPQDELLLTLVRFRLGLLHEDLAYRFGIAVSTVNDIITTWTQFMYHQFNRLSQYVPQTFHLVTTQ